MVRLGRTWKLYVFYTTVLVALMAVGGLFLQTQLKKKLTAHLQDDVLTLAATMVKALPDTEKPSLLGPWCREYQAVSGVRVTVLNRQGKVIGDSTGEAVAGEIRMDRPEVAGAIRDGKAVAIRHSETTKADMLYGALYVKQKGKVLRLGMSINKVRMIENQVMGFLSLELFLIPVLAMVLAFFFARHIAPEERSRIRGLKNRRK